MRVLAALTACLRLTTTSGTSVLPPAPPPGECVWDSAKGTGPPDTKTACKAMAPDISVTSTLTGTHAAASNVTHVDIQTVLYRTEPALVDAKKSRISVAAIPAGGCNGCDFFSQGAKNCSEQVRKTPSWPRSKRSWANFSLL